MLNSGLLLAVRAHQSGIAADYSEGHTRIIICNKKGEVGINLQIGTADVHHLTLPWTPASIDQPEGKVYLIADNPGSSVIFKAKIVTKNQFSGRFRNFEVNPIAGVDFDRPAWVASILGRDQQTRISDLSWHQYWEGIKAFVAFHLQGVIERV